MTPNPRHADEHGQTMAEYALVLGVITLAVLGALTLISGTISSAFRATLSLIP